MCDVLREAAAREIEKRGYEELAPILGVMPTGVESMMARFPWDISTAIRACELLELPLAELFNKVLEASAAGDNYVSFARPRGIASGLERSLYDRKHVYQNDINLISLPNKRKEVGAKALFLYLLNAAFGKVGNLSIKSVDSG